MTPYRTGIEGALGWTPSGLTQATKAAGGNMTTRRLKSFKELMAEDLDDVVVRLPRDLVDKAALLNEGDWNRHSFRSSPRTDAPRVLAAAGLDLHSLAR
jgi:hypothetical protein